MNDLEKFVRTYKFSSSSSSSNNNSNGSIGDVYSTLEMLKSEYLNDSGSEMKTIEKLVNRQYSSTKKGKTNKAATAAAHKPLSIESDETGGEESNNFNPHSSSIIANLYQAAATAAETTGDYHRDSSPSPSSEHEQYQERYLDPFLECQNKRMRNMFSLNQIGILESIFEQTHYPDSGLREQLSSKLNLSINRIQVWFQNRRAKFRKQESCPSSSAGSSKSSNNLKNFNLKSIKLMKSHQSKSSIDHHLAAKEFPPENNEQKQQQQLHFPQQQQQHQSIESDNAAMLYFDNYYQHQQQQQQQQQLQTNHMQPMIDYQFSLNNENNSAAATANFKFFGLSTDDSMMMPTMMTPRKLAQSSMDNYNNYFHQHQTTPTHFFNQYYFNG